MDNYLSNTAVSFTKDSGVASDVDADPASLRPDRDLFEDIWQVLDPYRVEDGPTIDQAITETCSAFGKYLSKVSWPNVHGGINAEQEAVTVGVCSLVIVYGKKRAMAILTEALRRTEALTVFASFEANP